MICGSEQAAVIYKCETNKTKFFNQFEICVREARYHLQIGKYLQNLQKKVRPSTKKSMSINKDMDKCAIIYRSSSVSFLFVCYHCAANFTDIDHTLKHIESHHQLLEVTIDETNVKTECDDFCDDFEDSIDTNIDDIRDTTDFRPAEGNVKIKDENMEIARDCGDDAVQKPNSFHCDRCDSVFSSKFSFRSHTLREHFKKESLECGKCLKTFKRDAAFKNHCRQHIERGDVDWNCEGDGIREPSTIECLDQREKSNAPMEMEIKSEKRQPKRGRKKIAEVASKDKQKEKVKDKQKPKEKEKPKEKKKRKEKKNVKETHELSIYNCHKCSSTYNTSKDLNDHLKQHATSDMQQIIKCKQCKTYFQSAFDLRLHVLEMHLSVDKFKCTTCSVEFKKEEKSLLEKHLKLHSGDNSVNWEKRLDGICDEGKSSEGKDAISFEEIVSNCELSCELCGEKFYLKSNLEVHVCCMHSENEKKLRCPQCESVFTKRKYYFAHQLEHRRVGATVTETDMNVLTKNLDAYIDEQSVFNADENPSNPYKCLICHTEKPNPLEIRLHVRQGHVYKTLPKPVQQSKSRKQEKISCNICGISITRYSFRNHFKIHTDVTKFPCSFCGKVFSKKYSKMTHERMHTGEKPFQCDQCGKRFFSSSLLGAHKQSHDNTTYPCKICGRVFNIPSGYRRHVQIHRKDQSFQCTICCKSFNTRVYLTKHMNKHNEKKFQCSFCENKFHTLKGQRLHEKCVHHYEARI